MEATSSIGTPRRRVRFPLFLGRSQPPAFRAAGSDTLSIVGRAWAHGEPPRRVLSMKETTAPGIGAAQEQLTASVQALTLPKGLYTFSVRSADPDRVAGVGGLMLPALHVGLGPSVPADGIEFLSGREDGATWLYAAGDMLVAKIIDRPGHLFLTRVRRACDETR